MVDVPRAGVRTSSRRTLKLGAVAFLVLVTVAISRIKPGAPSVDRASINLDTVRRGELVREVRAAGSLVPEAVLLISALSPGRIDRLHVRPGATVPAGMILLEMTNPDVRLEVLEAERHLAAAEAVLVTLQASLAMQRLNQAATVASVRTQQREAERQARAKDELMKQQVIAPLEAAHSRDQAEELTERLRIERERLTINAQSASSQLAVQRGEIARLRAIVDFQHSRQAALTVRASASGVVQEIPSETGQWVNTGQILVKLHSGDRLKAVLRVPELEAKDVAAGQAVTIDTRNGTVRGRVERVNPAVQGGIVAVDVALPEALPRGARPDLSVDGTIEVERVASNREQRVHLAAVTPGYFEAMGIAVTRGRHFTDHDRPDGQLVVAVSQSLADHYFPDTDPIGRHIVVRSANSDTVVLREIVAIVGDVRATALNSEPDQVVYQPHAQSGTGSMTFVVEAGPNARVTLDQLSQAVWRVDPGQSIYHSVAAETLIAETLAERRFHLLLLATFSTIGLLLAIVGVYGLIAYVVRTRMKEFGLRMALGATPSDVVVRVMHDAIRLNVPGVIAGMTAAVLLTRFVQHLLYEIDATDPATLAQVAVITLACGLAAALLPAVRAATTTPLQVLRQD